MTIDRVRTESQDMLERDKDGVLLYRAEIAGLPTSIEYLFTDGALRRVRFLFRPSHLADNQFVEDYLTLRDTLKAMHGTFHQSESQWRSELYEYVDDPLHRGLDVRDGRLVLFTIWKMPATSLLLKLEGVNFRFLLSAVYEPS